MERGAWWAIVGWGVAVASLMLPVTSLLWLHLPKLRFVQLPWRWLLCLNVAFTLLFTMACRRWLIRASVCVGMFLVLWSVWHHVQPPWWDTAADIQELHDFIEDGDGYEGTDEYVPMGIDPSEVAKNAPQVSAVSGDSVDVHMQKWTAESKAFTFETAKAQELRLRLFNYPAWKVEVDGQRMISHVQAGTGEILVPVPSGNHQVQVQFARTADRWIGGTLSVEATIGIIFLVLFPATRRDHVVSIEQADLKHQEGPKK